VHCPDGSRRSVAGSRRRPGPPLLGFYVPTTRPLRVPRSAAIGDPTAGGEGCQPLARFRPRGSSPPRRFQPRRRLQRARVAPHPPFPPSLRPGTPRPCFMPRAPMGFALQSFPLPGSRAAFRRPLLPCGFGADRAVRRGAPPAVRPLSAARLALAACLAPREGDAARDSDAGRGLPRDRETAPALATDAARAPHAGCPALGRGATDRRPPGSPALGRSARFEALLPPGVRSRDRPRAPRGLRPATPTADRAGALLGSRPSRAFSSTTSGSVDCDDRPANRAIAEVTSPAPVTETWLRP